VPWLERGIAAVHCIPLSHALESAKRLKKAHIRFGIAPWHAPTQCGLVECEFFWSRASHVDSRELTLGLPDVPDSIGNSSLTPL
jgi:hypothetical protein